MHRESRTAGPLRRLLSPFVAACVAACAVLVGSPAHAAPGDDPYTQLAADLSTCSGQPVVVLGADIDKPDGSLTVACQATLVLHGHSLAVGHVTIASDQRLTVDDDSGSGSFVVRSAGTAIDAVSASLTVKSGDVTVVGGTGGDSHPYAGNGAPAISAQDVTIDGGTTTIAGGTGGASTYGGGGAVAVTAHALAINGGTTTITGGTGGRGGGYAGGGGPAVRAATTTITGGTTTITGGTGGSGGGYAAGGGPAVEGGTVSVAAGTTSITGGAGGSAGLGGHGGPGIAEAVATVGGGVTTFGGGAGGNGSQGGSGGAAVSTTAITVTGGSVTASGGNGSGMPDSGDGGAGISAGSTTVDGGTLTATGGTGPAGALSRPGGRGGDGISQGDVVVGRGSLSAGDGAGGAGRGSGMTGTLEIAAGATASVAGSATLSTSAVDGTLRLLRGDVTIAESSDGPALTVGSAGMILGTEADPVDGASLAGPGDIDNHGVISLATNKVTATVLDHKYTVAFDASGGSAGGDVTAFAPSFEAGYRALPADPTRTHYSFRGWNTERDGGGTTFTTSTTLTSPLTVYAQWAANIITAGAPTVDGDAVVGQRLTVTPGPVTPADATSVFEWRAGDVVLGSGSHYDIEPGDLGRQITVTQTSSKDNHPSVSRDSAPTDPVAKGTLARSGRVAVTGVAKVGQQLTASSTVSTNPTASDTTGQWFRGGAPVPDATGTTYTLTNADVSSTLTYVQTDTLAGYEDLTTTSNTTEVVTGGTIALDDPTISGVAVVDGTLTAHAGEVSPAGAVVSFRWTIGDKTAAGDSYTVTADDVGLPITVTATATAPDYDDSSAVSAPTEPVAKAAFAVAPSASFTGVLKIGETLTGAAGVAVPSPDSYRYQWSAGGEPIQGADAKTLTLTSAEKGKQIAFTVVAERAGYEPATGTSAPSAPVSTNLAPTMSLSTSRTELRLGGSTTLRWTSTEAATVTASGSWSGPKPANSTQEVTPSATGTSTYVLTATNPNGSTTAQVSVPVTLAAKKLKVKATSTALPGKKLSVKASGLARGEVYTVRIGGVAAKTAKASRAGRVSVKVTVPRSVAAGKRVVRVTGSLADRTGRDTTRIVRLAKLSVHLAKASVRASDRQTVVVRHLRAGEKVTVRYNGHRISPKKATADRQGVYRLTFDVDIYWGRRTLTATGGLDGRTTTRRFAVVDRCPGGGYFCN